MSEDLLKVGGEEASLADIAGLDTTEIAAKKGSAFPGGAFKFKCEKAELKVVGAGDNKKAGVVFDFICTDVTELADDKDDPEKVVGRHHTEVVTVEDLLEDIGHIKAFMADAGYQGTGSLQDILADFQGTEFFAKVKQRKDKNDPDIVYSNIGIKFGFWKVSAQPEAKAA